MLASYEIDYELRGEAPGLRRRKQENQPEEKRRRVEQQ